MRRYMGWACLVVALAAQAGNGTLRVGNQVLVVGDSAARVVELLGKPSYRSPAKASGSQRSNGGRKARRGRAAETSGEQWQYRDGGRTVIIVVTDGRVSAIRDGGR